MNAGKKKAVLVMLTIFSMCFVFGAYKTISIVWEDKHSDTAYHELRGQVKEKTADEEAEAEEKTAKRRRSMDIGSLQETYPEIKGWLLAEGTGIDYPIMQTSDNEYYLSHLYDGTVNSNGSIFMDYRNTGMFTDDNTVIYGHRMYNGAMFHPLMEYKDQDFYEAHPTMMICTEEGDHLAELICGTIEDGNQEFVKFNFEDFEDMKAYVDELKRRSTFESRVTLEPGDKLVTMCTCTYERQNARYMLIGKISEIYECVSDN